MVGWVPESGGVRDRLVVDYSFAYVVRGHGRYTDEAGADIELLPGHCAFAMPGLRHSYGPLPGELWSELFVVFCGPVFDLWYQAGLLDPRRPVRRLEPVEYWASRIVSLAEALPTQSAAASERIVSGFLHLLTEILTENTDEHESDFLDRARALLEADRTEEPLEAIAAAVGVPYETLRKRFQQVFGVSPGRYRALHRVELARGMLLHTELTSRQIAENLGYSDEFHFAKRFKQLAGVTPREFRSAHSIGRG
jgi:AraC-like DNA-binding protein